ncbi:MAG: hypothetical protein AB7G21_04290 [Dehalococcoidia bacterium]
MSPFARHYLEMVAAMVAGMMLLTPPFMMTSRWLGYSFMFDPTIRTLAMATSMNIGMIAWMRYRGHTWERTAEMAVGMTLPFLAFLVPMWLGLISEVTLNVAGHLAMLVGMYVAMLFRRAEYSMDHSMHAHMHH